MVFIRRKDSFVRFCRHIQYLYACRMTTEQLIEIARENRRPLLFKLAALRLLVSRAPIQVTGGAAYAVRKRLTRAHYGI